MHTDETPCIEVYGNDHAACSFAGLKVRCDRCGRAYVCTPADDYYCTPEDDHCCERCLTGGRPVTTWARSIDKD